MRLTKERTLRSRSWDPVWESIFQNEEWGKYPPIELVRFIARNFYEKKRGVVRMLEVGCGPGASIWYLAREGFDVYGIDGSKTAIQKAKARIDGEGLKADLRTGDIISLPYESDCFDLVIDLECLYANSGDNTDCILQQIKRVLKDGGLFFSLTFTDKMYIGKFSKKLGRLEYSEISDGPLAGKGFVRLMDRHSIEKLYGKHFDIISVDRVERTDRNGSVEICEWVIVCQKSVRPQAP
jgi:SAM-dependent methyltransferase